MLSITLHKETIVDMTNNDIFKKLRVALHLRNDEIIDILKLVDFNVGVSELNALFRKDDHPKYMECGDQILRNFLNGLIIHMRGPKEDAPKIPKQKGGLTEKKDSRQRIITRKHNR